jgi:hypothetical protein
MRASHAFVPFVLSCALMGPWPEATGARLQPLMGPDAILSRMRTAYATCRTYRDSGIVRNTIFQDEGFHQSHEWTFATAFVRPDRFRFEYGRKALPGTRGPGYRHVIWRRGNEIRWLRDQPTGADQMPTPPGLVEEDVRWALVFANGTSRESSTNVPLLLMATDAGWPRRPPKLPWDQAERVDTVTLDGSRCYRITGTRGRTPVTVWIDAATFLLRKTHRQDQGGNRPIETTVTYDAAVDTEIPETLLELNAPGSVRR